MQAAIEVRLAACIEFQIHGEKWNSMQAAVFTSMAACIEFQIHGEILILSTHFLYLNPFPRPLATNFSPSEGIKGLVPRLPYFNPLPRLFNPQGRDNPL